MAEADHSRMHPHPNNRSRQILLRGLGLLIPLTLSAAADPPLTAREVDGAISRGVNWFKSTKKPTGDWETIDAGDRYWGGDTGLALLALLYSGEDPRGSELSGPLDWLAKQNMQSTYTYAVRAQVLAQVRGDRFRKRLEQDLEWLIRAAHPRSSSTAGGYGYFFNPQDPWYDNSNSQMAVLGAWSATEAGVTASGLSEYWPLVEEHWLRQQRNDGGWTYRDDRQSSGSMTAAGLSTFYILLDRIYGSPQQAKRLTEPIQNALDWMGREYTPDNPHGEPAWRYYYLYGVERAGRASGRKYFRDRDWFREGARTLLNEQASDGSWPAEGLGAHRNTAFALFFLCHGRAPLLFNKLEHGSDWTNYLRDVAGLTRFCERSLERMLNWQIVTLDGNLDDLFDAPVLYLSGGSRWEFTEAELDKLREYCIRGGMIFAVPQGGGEGFIKSMKDMAETILPGYPLRRLPPEHPLFTSSTQFTINDPPPILECNNGVRSLILLAEQDVSRAWHDRGVRNADRFQQFGCNVYIYATDKTLLYNRLETNVIPLEPVETTGSISMARLKYDGPWDAEPYGWTRLRYTFNNELKTALTIKHGVPLDPKELKPFKIAHISGTRALKLSNEERAALRRFLSDGGTLLADSAGASPEFLASFESAMKDLLKSEPLIVPPGSALITGKGITGAADLSQASYRRAARTQASLRKGPFLKAFVIGRRYGVLYSPLDLSTSLLGTEVFDLQGYEPATAMRIFQNLVLYANLSTSEKVSIAEANSK